ncbi:hypothetical protein ABKV19_027300 [Rosa sericea]
MTAAQALTHPWLRDERQAVPLDLVIYKLVKSYVRATPFRRAAMKALSKAITEDELYYLRAQFTLLEPKHGYVSIDNFRTVGTRIKTRKWNIVAPLDPAAFADAVVQIYLDNAGDLELIAKSVESSDLNFSRYGDIFF